MTTKLIKLVKQLYCKDLALMYLLFFISVPFSFCGYWFISLIRFIVGRVSFIKNGVEMKGNTADSCLLIFDTKVRLPKIEYIERDVFREAQ